jgi:hypothetical protein
MNLLDIFAVSNTLLDQLSNLAPKIIALAAVLATLVPETTPIIGMLLHRLAFNVGKAVNK